MSARTISLARAAAIASALAAASCVAPPPDFDYHAYLEHMPRSILVLPPLDESIDVDAAYGFLSRVSKPLAERGYYVFPVAVVDAMMKENGLPTPGEMNQVSLHKIDEVIGADAVMYVTVKSWGTSYHVLDAATVVTVEARLLDVKTGTEIWRGVRTAEHHSSSGGSEPFSMLAAALVTQMTSSTGEYSRSLSVAADQMLFYDPHQGLLPGPYDPGRDDEMKKRDLHRPN